MVSLVLLITPLFVLRAFAQENIQYDQIKQSSMEENIEMIDLIPDSRVIINLPRKDYIKANLPVRIIFYALPNGNTIEQTAGKKIVPADDWHFDIQHIAAQTRFLRNADPNRNYIVVYLQASMKAWTMHATIHPDSQHLYVSLVDTICSEISKRTSISGNQEIFLSSHSGGGRFLFNYINGVEKIPEKIKGIVFIDSSYGYEEQLHLDKLANWIKSSEDNRLAVFSYIDTTVILNGKHIVSSTGGTGYRSKMMVEGLSKNGILFRNYSDTTFNRFVALGGDGVSGGRVQILIKENPTGKIYHTVLVERNGFINSVLIGSPLEEKGYIFWGERAYSKFIE